MKPIKIYRFPETISAIEWVILGEEKTFEAYYYPNLIPLEKLKNNPVFAKIDDNLDRVRARMALNCYEGKIYEQFCVWRAEEEKQEDTIDTKCNCPKENFSFFGAGCQCGALKREQMAEAKRLWENAR